MKGQYFSFDAIIATVIMVIAFTSLVAYWYGVQSTIEERTGTTYNDALRIADSLFSPGVPADWPSQPITDIRQIGFADDFSNQLNRSKVQRLENIVNPFGAPDSTTYPAVGNIFRVQDYYITVEPVNGSGSGAFYIGSSNFTNARQVAVANRGGTMTINNVSTAVSIRVYVYQK